MLITSTDREIVYQLVVRFGTERAMVTIRCGVDGTAMLSAEPGSRPT